MATLRASAGLVFLAVVGAAQTPSTISFYGLSDSKAAPTFDHG